MKLHENKDLFTEIITMAEKPANNGGLGITDTYIEKDYWITYSLQLLSARAMELRAVFKGGTSLSKVYGIGHRFSEDIDVALMDASGMSDGQKKKAISRVIHCMSEGLENVIIAGQTRRSPRYRKEFFKYPCIFKSETDNPVFFLVGITIGKQRIESNVKVIGL